MQLLDTHPFFYIYFGFLGAAIASFVNVVVYRLPEGLSIVKPGSRCPSCETPIRWFDNIPILSYFILRGRCRSCGAGFSPRYAMVETMGAALGVAVFARFGFTYELLVWFPVVMAFLAIIFLDLDHWWIPDVISFPIMLWALAFAFLPERLGIMPALLGLIPALGIWLLAFVFERLTGREGMGMGDVKLLAGMGLLMGPVDTVTALMLASFQGAIIGIALLFIKDDPEQATEESLKTSEEESDKEESDKKESDEEEWVPHHRAIPFGPFLVLGTLEVVLLPHIFASLPYLLSFWILGDAGRPM